MDYIFSPEVPLCNPYFSWLKRISLRLYPYLLSSHYLYIYSIFIGYNYRTEQKIPRTEHFNFPC